jgi:hypothetical protein
MAIFAGEAVEIRSFGGAPSSLSLSEDRIISAVVAAAVTFDGGGGERPRRRRGEGGRGQAAP